jgi:hypothetical protein
MSRRKEVTDILWTALIIAGIIWLFTPTSKNS